MAFAVLGLTSVVANAATVTPGSEDLILGFQAPAGDTGSATNLEVDLGAASNFTSSTATEVLSQLNVNDLVATYGSNWTSDVTWSVAGITSVAGDANNPSFDLTSTTSIKENNASGLQGAYGAIENLAGGSSAAGSLKGQTSTANSAFAATIGTSSTPASGLSESYTSEEAGNGYTYAGNAEATGASTDELYSLFPSSEVGTGRGASFPAATDLGTFSLSTSGVLSFTGADPIAAPEPSTYAMMAGAMGLLFLAMRRRRLNV